MRGVLVAAVALAGLAAPGEAEAQLAPTFYSGNELLVTCDSNSPGDPLLCLGFVAAASDAVSYMTTSGGSFAGWRACIPLEVSKGQTRDVIVRHLRAHPEARHYSAITQSARALAEAFPCPRR